MPALNGIALLGWMDREQAIRYLREDCFFDPQITEEGAEALWRRYKDTVDGMPERLVEPIEKLPLSIQDCRDAESFKEKYRGDQNVVDVIRVDPMKLVIHHLSITTEQADYYATRLRGRGWVENCLFGDRPPASIGIRATPEIVHVDLPHPEFLFSLNPPGPWQFGIQQGGCLVTASHLETRLILHTGFHRTFAFCRSARNEPEAISRSVLIVLTRNIPYEISPACPKQGLREKLLGARPPMVSDYFDDRFFIPVKLRKKRYELQLIVKRMAIDEP
jgi:hypothetical protein